MHIPKLAQNHTYFGLVAVLLLTTLFFNNPDPELEKRVSDLEDRVTVLEEKLEVEDNDVVVRSSEGYKDLANWRQLRVNMSYDEVERLLGAPERINGGGVASWIYPNGGGVIFMRGRLSSWSEPR